jgi:HAD superfamily hydrolase (TIGR01484 family)
VYRSVQIINSTLLTFTQALAHTRMSFLQPFELFSRTAAQSVHTVLTDIDDTLTLHGQMPAKAYAALESLKTAGLRVIPVTGRPAGWCDHIARFWPVDAVVGENGAFYMWHDKQHNKMQTRHALNLHERQNMQQRLQQVQQRILQEVPGCALASDQFCRWYDLAIDFCEDVPPLPQQDIDRIATLMREAGMTAKISSIHVNGWFGDWDKLTMTRTLMHELYSVDLDKEAPNILFVGDSPNDAPMFAAFPNAIGVANVMDCLDRLEHQPRWVTRQSGGAGFVEIAQHLLALKF